MSPRHHNVCFHIWVLPQHWKTYSICCILNKKWGFLWYKYQTITILGYKRAPKPFFYFWNVSYLTQAQTSSCYKHLIHDLLWRWMTCWRSTRPSQRPVVNLRVIRVAYCRRDTKLLNPVSLLYLSLMLPERIMLWHQLKIKYIKMIVLSGIYIQFHMKEYFVEARKVLAL